MIRNAHYANYRGKMHRFRIDNGECKLISCDHKDLVDGFVADYEWPRVFMKKVTLEELTDFCIIYTRCLYQGEEYSVNSEDPKNSERILIGAYDVLKQQEHLEALGFRMFELGDFHKWVTRDEVEKLWEVKVPYQP